MSALAAGGSWRTGKAEAAAALLDLGIDPRRLPIRRVDGDSPYGAELIWVSIPDDARLVVSPMTGFVSWYALFHETGHAVAGAATEVVFPLLKGYEWVPGTASAPFQEASAELFAGLLLDPGFLARNELLPPERLEPFLACRRIVGLWSLRQHLAQFAFERALYAGDADPDLLAREANARYLRIATPSDSPPTWAADPFLAAYPCWTQNYPLAQVVAAQLVRALNNRFGREWTADTAVGPFLRDNLWKDGETVDWIGRVRRVTNEPVSPEALFEAWGF